MGGDAAHGIVTGVLAPVGYLARDPIGQPAEPFARGLVAGGSGDVLGHLVEGARRREPLLFGPPEPLHGHLGGDGDGEVVGQLGGARLDEPVDLVVDPVLDAGP